MAKTLTRQTRPAATSGQKDTSDGDALSSHLAHDLVYGANNLTYTMPFAGCVMTEGLATLFEQNTAPSGETYLIQVPTVLPRDMVRFAWTLGFDHGGPLYAPQIDVDSINVYLSPMPYTGKTRTSNGTYGSGFENSEFFFDTSKLGQPFGKSSYSTPFTMPGGAQQYVLVDNSAGSPGNLMPFENRTNYASNLNQAWLVLTVNRHTDDGSPLAGDPYTILDFTWWALYE